MGRKLILMLIFLGLCAVAVVITIMSLSIYDAQVKENEKHSAIGQCFEGYAVVSFAHGGSWSFAQVFERDENGKLKPVMCGKGPYNEQHWNVWPGKMR